MYKYNKDKEEDSDSGEDFDYGDEGDDEPISGNRDIDILDYISHMDVSNLATISGNN